MRRTNIAGLALTAVLLLCAAAPGTASATKLVLSEGGEPLEPGATFDFYGVGDNLNFTTPLGSIECSIEPLVQTGLTVSVLTNSKKMDELEISNGLGSLGGSPCRNNMEADRYGRASPRLASSAFLRLRGNGEATWGRPMAILLVFEKGENGQNRCLLSTETLRGANNATSTSEPLEAEFEHKLKLKKAESSIEGCPTEATMSVGFDTTENEAGEEDRIEEHTVTLP